MSEDTVKEDKALIVKEKFSILHHSFGLKVRSLLWEVSKNHEFSVPDFSQKCGVSANVIWNILDGDIGSISIGHLIIVCTAMGHNVDITIKDCESAD